MPSHPRIPPVIPAIESTLFFGQDAAPAFRSYLLHPFALMLFGLAPFLKIVGYMPMEFPIMTLWGDVAFYIMRTAIFLFLAVKFMPVVVPKLIARNVPFAVATFLFFMAFLIPNYIILHLAMPRGLTFWQEACRLFAIIAFSAFCHMIIMRIVEGDVLSLLGRETKLIPYYLPIKAVSSVAPHASLIDASLSGEVISLRAQNQYVLVQSDSGEKLVRMTLRAAIDIFPGECGQQVHRSWWLSMVEILRSTYDPSALQLETPEGRVYPVGKTYAPSVEKLLGRATDS